MDESGEAIRHGVVFETAFAVLAIVAAIFDGNSDERRQLAFRLFGDGKIVEGVADQFELTWSVVDDENWSFDAIVVTGGHINKDFSLFSHFVLIRLECGIGSRENFTVGESHGELEGFAFGIAAVGEVGIDLVFRTDGDLAIAFSAGILGIGGTSETRQEDEKCNRCKKLSIREGMWF